jgi:hypothetical protein
VNSEPSYLEELNYSPVHSEDEYEVHDGSSLYENLPPSPTPGWYEESVRNKDGEISSELDTGGGQ